MSIRHLQLSASSSPRKTTSTNGRLAAIQPFRFLDLPPEIRRTIYDLWIPSILHVSLGSKGIRLQYFAERCGALYFLAITIRPFFLNRQLYQEFCHALFARSTWCFSSADLLNNVFGRLPKLTRSRVRHISICLTGQGTKESSTEARASNDRLAIGAFQQAQRNLRQLDNLQTLVVSINLADFRCRPGDPTTSSLARNKGVANRLAANCVADFTWDGLQTRVPFAESNLSTEFTETLKQRCGEANVSLQRKYKDRYAGQMVDVVVSQCTVIDQPNGRDEADADGGIS
jgi:hypothetical protein